MVLLKTMMEKFHYYAKPEGEDPVNKIMGLAKYGILTGGFCTIFDACNYSKCRNATQFLNCAGFWMIPITGMCVTFSTVAYALTNIRKKDEKKNYMIAALASGAVLHVWLKTPLYTGTGTLLMVAYAALKKHSKLRSKDQNPIMPNLDQVHKSFVTWRNVPYRNYTWKPRWEFERTDYYTNFK